MKRVKTAQKETELILRAISELLNKGDNFIDVGSSYGQETIPIAHHLGATSKIFSFEPRIEAFTILNESIQKQQLSNIQTFNLGISDIEGELIFFQYFDTPKYPKRSQLSSFNEVAIKIHGEPDKKIYIKVNTLDNLFPEENIECIKIDIQSEEPRALAGAKRLIERCKPVLILEWEHIPDNLTDYWFNYFVNLGYKIVDINGYNKPVAHAHEIYSSNILRTNILCHL